MIITNSSGIPFERFDDTDVVLQLFDNKILSGRIHIWPPTLEWWLEDYGLEHEAPFSVALIADIRWPASKLVRDSFADAK